MSNLGKQIIVIVLILATVAIVASLWWKQSFVGSFANLSAVDQAATANPPVLPTERVSLVVDDQFPGQAVFVSSVVLPKGGWVVIQREENGGTGAIVGAGYFGPNVNTGEVNLPITTKEGEHYLAVLYRDNDDTSPDPKFDPRVDRVYLDDRGLSVSVPFQVTKDLPERKG